VIHIEQTPNNDHDWDRRRWLPSSYVFSPTVNHWRQVAGCSKLNFPRFSYYRTVAALCRILQERVLLYKTAELLAHTAWHRRKRGGKKNPVDPDSQLIPPYTTRLCLTCVTL